MIRSELVQKIGQRNPGLNPREVELIVTIFFDEITKRLAGDGRVELRGFGAFSTRSRGARTGRNPRTGETMTIKASAQPKFKAGKGLKDSVN